MNATGRRELAQLRADIGAVVKAVAETVFYRRTILDPPPSWPRFRLFLPVKKVKVKR